MKIALAFCFVSAVSAMAFVAWSQTESPEQAKPQIRSLSHAIHAVEDLDTTLTFYRDVFGLKGTPQDFPNPAVPQLTNAPGVTLRLSMMRLPGSMLFELTHFKGLERKPGRAAYTDPGAGSIVLYVRNLDEAVANAKKANAPIVTTGGEPVEVNTAKGKARSIVLRDPDGFFVQVVQETPAAGAPEHDVGDLAGVDHHQWLAVAGTARQAFGGGPSRSPQCREVDPRAAAGACERELERARAGGERGGAESWVGIRRVAAFDSGGARPASLPG